VQKSEERVNFLMDAQREVIS